MRFIPASLVAVAFTLAMSTAASAQQGHARHESAADLQRQARITEAQARRTALAAVPHGRVKSHELEREHGRLIYSYDISVPGHSGIEEVTVDARTGRIVTHEHETPAAERREARGEAAHPDHH